MRVLIQRVSRASVTIDGNEKREIAAGMVLLVGIGENDTENDASRLAGKIINLRVFPDENGRFDRSITDIGGEFLIVSQFTLYGDCSRGRRPDFTAAARPQIAAVLYQRFVDFIASSGRKVVTGKFAADMLVEIVNDGPVTLLIDSAATELAPGGQQQSEVS